MGPHGDLAGAGAEHGALGGDAVPRVQLRRHDLSLGGQVRGSNEELYRPRSIPDVGESHPAHAPESHEPPGHGNRAAGSATRFLNRPEISQGICDGVGAVESGGIGVYSAGAQALNLGDSLLKKVFASIGHEEGIGGRAGGPCD